MENESIIQNESIRTFCSLGCFGLWGIITFCPKNSEKKIDENHQVFMHNILC